MTGSDSPTDTAGSAGQDRMPTTAATVDSETPNARPIPCMDDSCRDADQCVWACEGRYYVPGADDAD